MRCCCKARDWIDKPTSRCPKHCTMTDKFIHKVGIGGILSGLLQHLLAERAQVGAGDACAQKRGQPQKGSLGLNLAVGGGGSDQIYWLCFIVIRDARRPGQFRFQYLTIDPAE